MPYDAFLSYSHDEETIAPSLRDALQHFAKPWWRRRALRVFLDRTALAANPGLWSAIVEAMDSADWMVLLASPAAAASTWVNNEVTHWLEQHGPDQLLIVLIDGELTWDRATSDFDAASTAIPAALRGAFAEEPRHVDLRWANDGEGLDLDNPRFRDQVAEIAAPMRGLTKEEIEGTDLQEHRRFRRTVASVAGALAVLAIIATVAGAWAISSARRASARTADADFASLVAQARNVRTSDPTLAMLLAVEATRMRYNSQSEGALLATMSQYSGFDESIVAPPPVSGITGVCLTDSGRLAVAGTGAGVVVADLRRGVVTGPPVTFGPPCSGAVSVACSSDGSTVVAYDGAGYWTQIDVTHRTVVGTLRHFAGLYGLAVAPDGNTVALADLTGHVTVTSIDGAGPVYTIEDYGPHPTDLVFSPDGATLATVNSGNASLWTVGDGGLLWHVRAPVLAAISATPRTPLLSVTRNVGDAAFSPDGATLAMSSGSQLKLIDVATGAVVWAQPTAWYDGSEVGFTSDGRLFANLSTGEFQQVDTAHGTVVGQPIAPQGGIAVNFDIAGTRIVTSSVASPTLSVFDADPSGPLTRAIPMSGASQLLEYDPTGRSLLVLMGSGSGSIFDVTRSVDQRTGSIGPQLPPLAQARFLEAHVVGGMQSNFTIGEIDSDTARPVAPPIAVPIFHLTNAQFDPRTHRILIANTTGSLDLYSPTGTAVASPWATLGGYPVLSSDGFAANGSIAAFAGGNRMVWVLNARGRTILQMTTPVTMAALSPDGSRLAVLHDHEVDLFDVPSGAQIGTGIGVPAGSTDLEFSRDGSRMLVFGQSQGVIVDVASGQLLGDPFPSTGYLALRPDGRQLAAITPGWILLWNLDSRTWPSVACRAAGRNLTRAEWRQYLPDAGSYQRTCPQWPAGT